MNRWDKNLWNLWKKSLIWNQKDKVRFRYIRHNVNNFFWKGKGCYCPLAYLISECYALGRPVNDSAGLADSGITRVLRFLRSNLPGIPIFDDINSCSQTVVCLVMNTFRTTRYATIWRTKVLSTNWSPSCCHAAVAWQPTMMLMWRYNVTCCSCSVHSARETTTGNQFVWSPFKYNPFYDWIPTRWSSSFFSWCVIWRKLEILKNARFQAQHIKHTLKIII